MTLEILYRLLRERAYLEGDFVLASGARSSFYVDCKMAEVYSRSAFYIGEALYDSTKDLAIDAIGGLETGAIPLITSTVISYHHHGREMEGFWVRDVQKTHGTKKLIEGHEPKNERVVIVDDVITSGGSAMKAVDVAQGVGAEIVGVIALIDRQNGAGQLFQASNIEYKYLFKGDGL